MKKNLFVLAIVVGGCTSMTLAGSVSGPGGLLPPSGTGGGGVWNNGDPTAMPTSPFTSVVNIADGIASVESITFTALVHSWIGDLQAVLVDPDGVGHNIFVRAGVGASGSTVGSANNVNGDYTFVESGAPNDLPVLSGGDTNFVIPGGTFNQTFQGSPTLMGSWVDGSNNIYNTPLSQINGSAGDWTLFIYDWAGGDPGSLGGWTLNYTGVPAPGALALLGLAGLLGARRRRDA